MDGPEEPCVLHRTLIIQTTLLPPTSTFLAALRNPNGRKRSPVFFPTKRSHSTPSSSKTPIDRREPQITGKLLVPLQGLRAETMSGIPQHRDATGAAALLRVWNNEAFDDGGGDSGGSASSKKKDPAWRPLRPAPAVRPADGISRGAAGKENRGSSLPGPSPILKNTPARPISKTCPFTPNPAKQPATARKVLGFAGDDSVAADDADIEAEIQAVEEEIGRLTLRLEALLRLQRAERNSRACGRRGRVVPAKYLEPKTSSDQARTPASKKVQETPARSRLGRRGASLGPMEIIGLRPPGIPGSTPQDRRKSCIFKLQDVAEGGEKGEKATPAVRTKRTANSSSVPVQEEFRRRSSLCPSEIAGRGAALRWPPQKKLQEIKEEAAESKKESRRSSSSSPKSGAQPAAKLPELRKGVATVETKRSERKGIPTAPKNLRPRMLFQEAKKPMKMEKPAAKEGKKAAPASRPRKNVKMKTVASRYSLITVRFGRSARESKRRKWSLPVDGSDDGDPAGGKRSRMSMGGDQWEEVAEQTEESAERSPPSSIAKIARSLPMIRTVRCAAGTPRDSGRAKRVAELMGRESHFDAVLVEEGTVPDSGEDMELELAEDDP